MSLRDDLTAMEQHIYHGTFTEFMLGTAPMIDTEGYLIAPEPERAPEKDFWFSKPHDDSDDEGDYRREMGEV